MGGERSGQLVDIDQKLDRKIGPWKGGSKPSWGATELSFLAKKLEVLLVLVEEEEVKRFRETGVCAKIGSRRNRETTPMKSISLAA